MEYRRMPRSNEQLSVIGIGGGHLHELGPSEMLRFLDYAVGQGINVIDLAASYAQPLEILGEILADRRRDLYYQVHLGLVFIDGQYGRSRILDEVKTGFFDNLRRLRTDYADIGFIHYVDEMSELDLVHSSGIFDYALELKRQGVVRRLGFASHKVDVSMKLLETGVFDMCMFSVNAAYDFDPVGNVPFDGVDMRGQDQLTVSQERARFYRDCERRGVGIQVMKAFGGGILLDGATSPFGQAMTTHQCLQYALDRPAVVSCLLGVKSQAELADALTFFEKPAAERDYAFTANMRHEGMRGACVYCNHCLPCPANIDIAAVNKYLDLYLAGDKIARGHYLDLRQRAADCTECARCEENCPFAVPVRERMRLAVQHME